MIPNKSKKTETDPKMNEKSEKLEKSKTPSKLSFSEKLNIFSSKWNPVLFSYFNSLHSLRSTVNQLENKI